MVSLCPFCALLSLKKNSFYEQGKILNWVGELLSWKVVLENDSVRREGRADMGWEGDGRVESDSEGCKVWRGSNLLDRGFG